MTLFGVARHLPRLFAKPDRPARFVGAFLVLLSGALMLPLAGYGVLNIVHAASRVPNNTGETVDFLAFYTGGRLLLTAPAHVYDSQAWASIQQGLHAALPTMEFLYPPQTALLLAPLALLPYGAAYFVWLGFNLACLAIAGCLLAPRGLRSWQWMLTWIVVSALFMPAQLGLLLGQLSFVLLLGFALFVRFSDRPGWVGKAVALLPWACKPQLLPSFLMCLALSRNWRAFVLACALPLALSGLVVLVAGPGLVLDYARLASGEGSGVLIEQRVEAGQGVLGMSQWVLGRGWLSTSLSLLGTLAVYALVGHAWRRGLRQDAGRSLQLAMLPVAAFLTSPHALAYDAAPWLASMWLLLRFSEAVPRVQAVVIGALILGWWGSTLATLPGVTAIAPVAGFTALLELLLMTWLLHHARGADALQPPDTRAATVPGARRFQIRRLPA